MALLNPARAAGAAALALLTGACEHTRPPTYVPADEDQLVVAAVLHAGSDSAAVLVVRAGRGDAPPAVSRARVRIVGPGGTGVLTELVETAAPCGRAMLPPLQGRTQTTGCYAGVVPGGVRAGAEYALEVDVPTGERVRGRTVVPFPPEIQAPADRLRVYGARAPDPHTWVAGPVALRWRETGLVTVAGWAGQAWARGVEPHCAMGLREMHNPPLHMDGDSLLARLYLMRCMTTLDPEPLRPDSAELVVDVTAFDSAMSAYIRQGYTGEGVPRADASTGLQGAYGIFGSAAASRRRILFIPAD